MVDAEREVVRDVSPWIKVYKDGTIERLWGNDIAPPGFDSETGVTSKDVVISQETGVSARLFRPTLPPTTTPKLPLLVYFHGGAFCCGSPSHTKYHKIICKVVAEANIIAVSVDYRRAPEHPLPAAYDDCWDALRWVWAHGEPGGGSEDWLKENVDFDRVTIGGDSAGGNITHHVAMRAGTPCEDVGLKIKGAILIHPYFWSKVDSVMTPETGEYTKAEVDNWVEFVCKSGLDDPYINPFAEGSKDDVSNLGCDRALVCVAEKDILRDRGKFYYESLARSNWKWKAELVETAGEDHVFHLYYPNTENAVNFIKTLAEFINRT